MRPLLRRFTLALLALVGCAAPEAAPEPQGHVLAASAPRAAAALELAPTDLEVHFIDVGTGDCIWIRTGDDGIPGNGRFEGLNIVIDGGDWGRFGRVDGYAFASEYLLQQDRLPAGARIDWLVLSHPHSDRTPTRLKRLSDRRQERLANWGYAISDAALRRHAGPLDPPGSLPYPESSI